MSDHKLGINPGFLIKHKLKLTGLEHTNTKALVAELNAQIWIDRVWLSHDNQSIKIAYEASRHNIDEIIAVIEKYGASIKDDWWSRLKVGWQRQTDENIRNNAQHEPHCCNKVPSSHGSKPKN